MLTEHRKALVSARTELLRSINMGERLLSALVSDCIITCTMKEEISVSARLYYVQTAAASVNRWYNGWALYP